MLKLEGVTKKFGQIEALMDCNLIFEPGKIYGLLGPNGSGKSTLMKIVAGLLRPGKGQVRVEERPISYLTKSDIVFMPTESYIYDHLSIEQVKTYFQDFYRDFDVNKFDELIEGFALDSKRKVKSLSTGMHAKLKVAVALSRKAKIYMLDEPLNGIDLVARDQIIRTIITASDEKTCMILSSHFVDQMESILDEVVFLKDGKVVLQGEAEEIRQDKQKSIVDLYKEVFSC